MSLPNIFKGEKNQPNWLMRIMSHICQCRQMQNISWWHHAYTIFELGSICILGDMSHQSPQMGFVWSPWHSIHWKNQPHLLHDQRQQVISRWKLSDWSFFTLRYPRPNWKSLFQESNLITQTIQIVVENTSPPCHLSIETHITLCSAQFHQTLLLPFWLRF